MSRSLLPVLLIALTGLACGGGQQASPAPQALEPQPPTVTDLARAGDEPLPPGFPSPSRMELPEGWLRFSRVANPIAPGISLGRPSDWIPRARGTDEAGSFLLRPPTGGPRAFNLQWFAKDAAEPSALLSQGLPAFIQQGFPLATESSRETLEVMGEERTLIRFDHPPDEGKPGETLLLTLIDLQTHWLVAGGLDTTADFASSGDTFRTILATFSALPPDPDGEPSRLPDELRTDRPAQE